MPKPAPSGTQYDAMNGLFRACGYPTASTSEMKDWNNLTGTSTAMTTASLFTAGGGIMSVGLFQYDMSCLLNVCASQYSHTVNKWCHFINSEFDGWAIGAYISAPAHPVVWTGTPPVHPNPAAAR
jgi:hypothetical protein